MEKSQENRRFKFIGKAVYFKNEKIIVFGDMHLGYGFTFRENGSQIQTLQLKETKKDLEKTLKQLKKENKKIEKIILLGDVKHFFSYNKGETKLILEILTILKKYVKKENIILIKGNHEKITEIGDKKFVDYYIEKDIAFIHGDNMIKEAFDKKIRIITMGHLHPAITLTDYQRVKSEKYKCFLVGRYKSKEIIILPSFLQFIEGTSLNEYTKEHCFIPTKNIKNFKVYVIGKNEVFNFGILKRLVHEFN
ncbi:MAG: metallophosphoesterase [Candidatus Pacearchaeota archaeon]